MTLCECTNCNWTGDPDDLVDYNCPMCHESVAFYVSDTAEYIQFLRGELNKQATSKPMFGGAGHR